MPSGKRRPLPWQQLVEEGAVAAERDPQLLGGRFALPPLAFQFALVLGERGGQRADHGSDQFVGLLDGLLRVVDEAGLDVLPAVTETGDLLLVDQRRRLDVVARPGGSLHVAARTGR